MKKINFHCISILVLLALSLIFFNSLLHKGVILSNIHYINDLTFLSYNTKEAVSNNEFPLWTPYFYMGHPLIAIPENYMLDLNFLLIYLFRNIYLAMNLSLILYLFIAGLGMYILVYSVTQGKKAAFISAILYMFNGFMYSFMLHGHINILEGYSLIPFIFLFAHKALKSRNFAAYSILAGVFFALQILAGSIVFFFYTALALGLYFIFSFVFSLLAGNFKSNALKLALVGFLIAVTALSLSSIKLLPVLEFTKMSSRSNGVSYNEYLGEPVSINSITSIAITNTAGLPVSGAIGIAGFLLLIFGLANYKKKLVIFCLIAIVFSLLFASGTFVASLMYKAPGFQSMRHVERALVLFVFAGSILAAYGYIFLSEKLKRFQAYVKYEKIFFAAIIFLILIEALLLQKVPLATKITEPDDIKLLEHMGRDNSTFRTINLALNDIIGAAGYNYYSQKGISEVKGGGGIWVNDYAAFVAIAQQSLSPKILGTLNVKYVISGKKLEAGNLTLVNRFNVCYECMKDAFGPYLYKNEHFLPRYYIVPNSILIVGDDALAKQLIYSLMFQNWQPGNSVLVKGTKINDYSIDFLKKFGIILLVRDSVDDSSIGKLREYASQGGLIVPDILNGQNSVSAEDLSLIFNKTTGNYTELGISEYSNNKVVLELNGQKGWLVASERFAHFPGWEAKINSKRLDLLKADNVITALYLEGDYGALSFEYKPKSYRTGRAISLASLIGILAYFGYLTYKKFKGGQNKS